MFDSGTDDSVSKDQNMPNIACNRISEVKELLGMDRRAFCTSASSKSTVHCFVDEDQSSGGLLHAGDICTMVTDRSKRSGNDVLCILVNLFWLTKDKELSQFCIFISRA